MGKDKAKEKSVKGQLYICIQRHEEPLEVGFKKYKVGDKETFDKTPPEAFWRPMKAIKKQEVK